MSATLSPFALAADIFDPPEGTGLWTPYPKQALASELAADADELLFGGAAGPGKTEWLCEYFITEMETIGGNRGLILRRVFPSLNRTIIPRLKAKLKGRAKWNSNEHTFTFPNESILECGSLQYYDDVLDYQGAEYGIIGFEEITEFMREQYEFMLSRVRSPVDGVRAHTVSTTNPGGPGHGWVKKRWVKLDPKAADFPGEQPGPYQIWKPKPTPENNEPGSRCFVPATSADNPALLKRNPNYLNQLRAISKRGVRLALEKGDWDAIDQVEGALWSSEELELGRISPVWFKTKVRSWIRAISVDPADGNEDGDAFGVSMCSRGQDGVGYVEGSWQWRETPRKMARAAIELYHDYGCSVLVVERNHGGKWMVEVFRSVDPTVNIQTVWASDGKRTRAEPVSTLFEPNPDALGDPTTPRFKARLVGFHPELEEEMTTTTFKPGEVSPNQIDALVWNLSYLMLGLRDNEATEEIRDERLQGRR